MPNYISPGGGKSKLDNEYYSFLALKLNECKTGDLTLNMVMLNRAFGA